MRNLAHETPELVKFAIEPIKLPGVLSQFEYVRNCRRNYPQLLALDRPTSL